MRRVGGVLLVMGIVLVATWVAFRAVGDVSPGWSLLVLIGGAAIEWALYRRWGKPALDGWVQDLNLGESDEPDDPRSRRFHDLVPYGSMTSRGAWTLRHPWLASIYWTLGFGVFMLVVSLGLPPTRRTVLLVGYFLITPFAFRVGLAYYAYQEQQHRPPR